jgi:hypothetical protein
MKRVVEKDPRKLLELGKRLAEAKRSLSPVAYTALVYAEPELRHEFHPEKPTADKEQRLRRLAAMRVLWDFINQLPRAGWSALRELSKLNEQTLRCMFERGRST